MAGKMKEKVSVRAWLMPYMLLRTLTILPSFAVSVKVIECLCAAFF